MKKKIFFITAHQGVANYREDQFDESGAVAHERDHERLQSFFDTWDQIGLPSRTRA
jgi:hypothetical protein